MADEILMPGEVEYRTRMQREKDGIAVDDETWRQIQEKGKEVGVNL